MLVKKELVKIDKLFISLFKKNIHINIYAINQDPRRMLNMNIIPAFIGKYKNYVKAKIASDSTRYSKTPNIKLYFEVIKSNKISVTIKKDIDFKNNYIYIKIEYDDEYNLYCIIPYIKELIKKHQI